MRNSISLLCITAVVCFSVHIEAEKGRGKRSTIEETIWILRKLRYDASFDVDSLLADVNFEDSFHLPKYVKFLPEIYHTLFHILKETLPYSAHPTEERLTQLADQLVNGTNKMYQAVEDEHLLLSSELIYTLARNSTALTREYNADEVVLPLPPLTFDGAMHFLSQSDQRVVRKLVAYHRCMKSTENSEKPNQPNLNYRELVERFAPCSKEYNFRDVDQNERLIVRRTQRLLISLLRGADGSRMPFSPSKFANALGISPLRETRPVKLLAISSRCFFDGIMAPILKNISQIEDECKTNFIADYLFHDGNLPLIESLQFIRQRNNAIDVVAGFARLIDELKKPESYGSFEALAAKFEKLHGLKAVFQIFSEIGRCMMETNAEKWTNVTEEVGGYVLVAKQIFTNEEEPGEQVTRYWNEGAFVKFMQSAVDSIQSLFNEGNRTELEQFTNCLLPASHFKKLTTKIVISENLEKNLKFASEIGREHRMIEALLILFYEHLNSLCNRIGMTNDAKQFIVKVLDAFSNEYLPSDAATEAGKMTREAVLTELRNSFLHLPEDAMRALADSLPYRITVILSILF